MAEITSPVQLTDRSGRLNRDAVGWSRTPLHLLNLSGRWPRKKRWNYWAFTNGSQLFSLTVSNVDYLGLAFVYVADLETGEVVEETVVAPFGKGCDLPRQVHGDVGFESKRMRLSMIHRIENGHHVEFTAEIADFGGRRLEAELLAFYPPGHQTLNVVIPWDERRFQFTAKHNTLPVSGTVRVGEEAIEFSGDQSFATLDLGRGVWPASSTWNWGSASGTYDQRTIGLNLGGKWTDGTGQTENAVCVDGELRKNDEDLVWQYDPSDWMKPWQVFSPFTDDVDVVFSPRLERVATTNAILLKSEVHQLFGTYSGKVKDAAGDLVSFEGLMGWAEEHKAVW